MTLGFVAAILCLTLVLAGASMGLTGSLAFSQPSASPSGSPSGGGSAEPAIFLLNPSAAYKPTAEVVEPPNSPLTPGDVPKISDKFDGQDEAYHVVAVVKNAPPSALIEAYFVSDLGGNEVTVGQLTPVPGSPDTYEVFWDVPQSMDAYYGTFTVRLFQDTPGGFEEVAADDEIVRLQHKEGQFLDEPPIAQAETVELTWPSQNGPLGFYKPAGAGAVWRTVVEGTASPALFDPTTGETPSTGADQVRVMYSTTPIGEDPEFVQCASPATSTGGPNGEETWAATCGLNATHRPSQVTALAAVAMQNHSRNNASPQYSQESADVHRVTPYMQRVEDMKLDLTTSPTGNHPSRRHVAAGTTCLSYEVTVTDALDRPVQGANVDIHVRGPGDQVQFGVDTTSGNVQSGKQKPQKDHASEGGNDCDFPGDIASDQGDHNVPSAEDIKHVESTNGSGLSSGAGATFGQWQFYLYSGMVGDTEITAWVDEETVRTDTEKREPDDDILEPTELSVSNFAQWLPGPITVSFDPTGATAAAGTCQRYIVRVRSGTRAVRGANVDVHATGPTNDLDFCDPGDASPRRAPDAGVGHNAEDEGEMAHAGQPPVAQHTEGVSNNQGNFVIGITSPAPGDTTLTAWYDAGEDGFDNDELGSDPNGTATTNWIQSTGDSSISFLNPSPYGPGPESAGDGTNVGKKQDVDAAFHLVARVASLGDVPGVEFFYRSGSNPLVKIGDGTRIGSTDVYETYWPVDVADGEYTLIARIVGTQTSVEQDVLVNNATTQTNPADIPFETAEITSPVNGQRVGFVNRKLTVRGVASAGAEGVDLFYTKASSIATPGSDDWIFCGYAAMGTGTAPKEFTGDCELDGPDQPGQVTGIAAITFDCVQSGCNGAPGAGPEGIRNVGENDSGDAHRVFGVEAAPSLSMEPAETAADVDECVTFVVSLSDQTGQPIPGRNVDVHMTGPGNSGNFCAPEDGSGTPRRAPNDGGHVADGNETDEAYHDDPAGHIRHTEAETTGNGRLVFAIESATAGDTQLTVWLDDNDNDAEDQGELRDVSVMHWETESACDISGTDGPDVLEGSDASEKICGFGGDDVITGGGGDDVIGGGAGNDVLRGNAGNDSVRGGAGNDKAFGGGGTDRTFGGGGNDVVAGHRSDDFLRGNRGNDRLNGGPGRDDCGGGRGRDQLRKCETGTRSFAARTRPI